METIRHIAAEPIADVQLCSRCGGVIERDLMGGLL